MAPARSEIGGAVFFLVSVFMWGGLCGLVAGGWVAGFWADYSISLVFVQVRRGRGDFCGLCVESLQSPAWPPLPYSSCNPTISPLVISPRRFEAVAWLR